MPGEHTANHSYAFLHKNNTKSLLQRHALTSSSVQFALDLIGVLTTLYLLVINKTGEFSEPYLMLGTLSTLLMVSIYYNRGIYSNHKTLIANSFTILKSWVLVAAALLIIAFVTKQSQVYSREVMITWFFIAGAVQVATHAVVRVIVRKRNKAEPQENALLIGAGEISQYLAQRINDNPWLHKRIIGVLDDDEQVLTNWSLDKVQKLGGLEKLDEIIKSKNIKSLYVSLPINEMEALQKIHIDSLDMNVAVYWVPPIFDMTLINHNIKQIGNVPVIALSETPLNGRRGTSKMLLDYSLTTLALIALSPLLIATAIAVKLSSKGPVLFKQKRHGMQGEVFNVWKFRSMRAHQESDGEITQASKEDPRITRVGRFIRKTSIDELPQLYNVLNGTMSLVGPRPHAVEHNDFYSNKVSAYMARHNIKPGLTGLAQVNDCRGETKTIEEMARRVEFDLEYINNWSAKLDIAIIFKTIFVLFSDKAY